MDVVSKEGAMLLAAFIWLPVLLGLLVVTLPIWLPIYFGYGTWCWIKEISSR
jgi:hypothetical protein